MVDQGISVSNCSFSQILDVDLELRGGDPFRRYIIFTHILSVSNIRAFSSTINRRATPSTPARPFPGEYDAPKIVSAIPGPESKKLSQELDKRQDTRTQHFFVDYKKSKGNYVVDADGNVMLDILCSIASHSIGYNAPALVEAARSEEWVTALINRPATGVQPSTTWPGVIENGIMSVAPKGLNQVFTAMCGSCANETAYKAVFMHHMRKVRGDAPYTQEELQSCMKNEAPGAPNLSIMSFKGGFHGRLFGSLSTTRSKALHKIDIPAFDWPQASFPALKYPLEQFEAENRKEEDRCLKEVEEVIEKNKGKVVGLIVEPIQGEGGDNYATPYFFQKLRKITKEHDVALIVDEVQTGVGATGKFWAHEHWDLDTPPDVVTFSKKMQAAGFYHSMDLRNFNTWLGDPIRALQASVIIKEIKDNHLLENVQVTGEYLKNGLEKLRSKHTDLVSNVRGVGTFLAFDLPTPELQDKFLRILRQKGVEATGSGTRSIRFRPMLIFAPKHAQQFLDLAEEVLQQLKA
ncbi:4-aminobutyrate transaminase [Planoprotostelium fungivorum]|uniref:4-aminobutyrate--2-oxoglutarate transaminase n=1 Tax=Planoprotostelium fungivorum TaxID=1890364 RepID=A0A2P6NE81_9EUKA|nr:4-aminobutyrate transaminase [Planoprotostelium fungivorum]